MSNPSIEESKRELDSSPNGSITGHDPAPEEEMHYPSGFALSVIMAGLVAAIFLISLDTTIVSTAIPRITDEFHTVADIGWYGSAFFLTLASFQGTWGKIYRYFPLKLSFTAAVLLFEVGSMICAVAQNSVTLIVGRAIAGIGAAGISSGSYTILAFSVHPSRRAAMTGAIGASFAVAAVAGPLIGGAFTSNTTWRWHRRRLVRKNVPYKEILLQMDPSGIVLLLGAILCFLLALQWGGSAKAWGSADVVGTLVGFGLLLIAFTINELWLQEKAMIPPRLLKGQTILFSCLFTFFFSGSFYLLLYYLPTYFQSVKGASASDSGVHTLPLVLGDGLFATLSGAALGIIGYYMPLLTLGGVLTTVASGLLYTLDLHSGSNEWIGYQAMAGIGVGLAIQVPMMTSQAVVGVEDLSTVSAMILFFQCMGGAIFVQAGQAAFTNKLVQEVQPHLPNISAALVTSTGATELQSTFHGHELQVIVEAYVAGLQDAFIVSTVLAGIATLLSFGSGWKSVKSKKGEAKAQP
ncbi:hypothetical protein Aspvir_009664 [Aspergillus viridinutans]|uniref:Major facilitator superfamily (MFS) profile domain-containing protein n=1 Tax=Aspergillus viridinutans TaxID=75553 RepID=A0A9P3C5G7_ASPVI|nr:uncharacterized protein Aspvir_009664 [Aspergillus viridinutans]GIK05551.1 hypothetical protein Aspvir_009664 [Aspergillus viridinutans]